MSEFYQRGVQADLDALNLRERNGVALADPGVEEAGVDKAYGDAFFAGKDLLVLDATEVRNCLSSCALLHAMCVLAVASSISQVSASACEE
jgi:hypothetical protein